MLLEESGIDPEVIAERGYATAARREDLPQGFGKNQRRAPALTIPVYPLGGAAPFARIRPDNPRPAYKRSRGRWARRGFVKYEQPKGRRIVLDVPPRNREAVKDPDVPLWITEGEKKADSLTSRGCCAVGLFGVDCWGRGGELLPDWNHVALDGREVLVVFDSDLTIKPEVQDALRRMTAALEARGAVVLVVYLSGPEKGVDDYLAAGGTVEEMKALARPFDPGDLLREKLTRSERLRQALEDLRRQHNEMPTKTRSECSTRAAWRACVAQAERSGKPVGDGVEVRISSRTGAELAAMSHMTFARRMNDLIEAGRVRRVEGEHADSYALLVGRAALLQKGEGREREEEHGTTEGASSHAVTNLRGSFPELREPYVATVREKDRKGRLVEVHEYVARLSKRRGEVVRFLLERGGSSTVPELMERFAGEKTRPRDFVRRQLSDLLGHRRQYHGKPLAVGPPIIEMEGEVVRLVDGWLDALEVHRELGGEEDAAIRQKANHLRQRAAWRGRNATKADRAPTEKEMEEGREERRKRRKAQRFAYQGMDPRAAAKEVLGADGFVGDLSPEADPDPPPGEHPLSCDCLDCSATTPSYARISGP